METERPARQADSEQMRSQIKSAAILLAIFVAMYLMVGGIVHLLGAPVDARVSSDASEFAPAAIEAPDADGTTSPREHGDAHID